jgi:hypothetical protein
MASGSARQPNGTGGHSYGGTVPYTRKQHCANICRLRQDRSRLDLPEQIGTTGVSISGLVLPDKAYLSRS